MSTSPAGEITHVDVVVVGAGFSGLYLLYRLRRMGLTAVAFEAGAGVGGTWFWNNYPGARCDIESVDYSFSFSPELEQEWSWSEKYPSQPELLRYLNHVADRFDLRRDIMLSTRVVGANWDDKDERWLVTTDRDHAVSASFCVMATGMLSAVQTPPFAGMEAFEGATYHTGQWPAQPVDLAGARVGVIGTGSSGIQVIPELAQAAAELTVFQRTPNFSIPAWNDVVDPEWERAVKASYGDRRATARWSRSGTVREINPRPATSYDDQSRLAEYQRRWEIGGAGFMLSFSDLMVNATSNDSAAQFVHARIREIVHDPAVAEALCPKDYPIGTKRICVDTGYYATFNRDNVTLVDVRDDPIECFYSGGIQTARRKYELDAIVCATGFDAMTGALQAIEISGRGGLLLRDKWAAGPRTYLGLATAGFPNLFIVTGPGSPSVLSNMLTSIEQHVEWITDLMGYLSKNELAIAEPETSVEDEWVQHVNELAEATLHMQANSWYLGANVPGKPRVFMPYIGGVGTYRATCHEIALNDYRGFTLTRRSSQATPISRVS